MFCLIFLVKVLPTTPHLHKLFSSLSVVMYSEKLQGTNLFREHSELLGRTGQSNLWLIAVDYVMVSAKTFFLKIRIVTCLAFKSQREI